MHERVDMTTIWTVPKPVVGMVHLLPLPGAPGWRGSMGEVLDRAAADASALAEGGADGVLVENYGDAPFHPSSVPAETTAALAVAVAAVAEAVQLPVGVNVLRNDATAAIAIAAATRASFIRVNVHTGAMLTDQGWIEGRAHDTVRLRQRLAPAVALFADVLVKHATPPPGADAAAVARDTWQRGRADALIVTGAATGAPADATRLRTVREAVPGAPVWLGSGLDVTNVRAMLPLAYAAIVGGALQRNGVAGHGVEVERVRRFMDAVRDVRNDRVREVVA